MKVMLYYPYLLILPHLPIAAAVYLCTSWCFVLFWGRNSLGWSDIELFAIFENGHYAADQVYFYQSNSKKSANLAACAAKFSHSKNDRDLKMNIAFWKFANKFLLIQEQSLKIKFEIKFCSIFFFLSKNCQNGFWYNK